VGDGSGGLDASEGGTAVVARGGSGSGAGGTGAASGGRGGGGSGGASVPGAGSGGVATGGIPNGAGRGAGGRVAGGRNAGGRGAGGRGAGGRGRGGAGSGGVAGSNVAGSPDAGAGGSSGSDCVVRVATAGSDANDGSEWTLALGTVQGGLELARSLIVHATCPSVDIWVAAGTYTPSVLTEPGDAQSATFQLSPNVGLYGGFAGTEAARSQRDFAVNVSVLSGEIGNPTDPGDNAYHVVTGSTGATLDGFTIEAGTANGSSPNNTGAGMFNDAASPVVENCIFRGNSAGGGGAMYNHASSPLVNNCGFFDNQVPVGDGGAIDNDASSPVVSACTFTNNSARYSGGAINNINASSPTVARCAFTGNNADSGGAIASDLSSLLVTDSAFSLNSAYLGGALVLVDSSGTVQNTRFDQNSAYQGGAVLDYDGALVLTNATFWANSVSGTERFTNVAQAAGGAIYNENYSSVTVTGSTFANNVAAYAGGAIYAAASTLFVTNTILWGDVAGSSVSEILDADAGAASNASYSIIRDGYPAGTGVILSNPSFVAGASGDLQLGFGSPAIDAGTACADGVTLTDGAGNGRWDMANVPNVASGVDIGAFEYQGTAGVDTPIGAVCQ